MDWSSNEPLIKNKRVAEAVGVVFVVLGVVALYDAHEGRGDSSPFWAKFLPGI